MSMAADRDARAPLACSAHPRRGVLRALVVLGLATVSTTLLLAASGESAGVEQALWDAAQRGDLAAIQKLKAQGGVNLDSPTKYGATALSFACDKGHVEVAAFLIENGADVNHKDSFYGFTPIDWALFNEHVAVVKLLLQKGAAGADRALSLGVRLGDKDLVAAAAASGQLEGNQVAAALEQARTGGASAEIIALLEGVKVESAPVPEIEIAPEALSTFTGRYRNADLDMTIDVTVTDGKLVGQATGQPPLILRPIAEARFEAVEFPQVKLAFSGQGGKIDQVVVEQGGQTFAFPRIVEQAAEATPPAAAEPAPAPEAAPAKIARRPAQNWPSFRGPDASGVADGQGAVVEWNVEDGRNVLWKTAIPGLANSSPIVWGDRVFVTTAVSSAGDETFRTGLYGDVNSVDDQSEHAFKVYALDRRTGKILWERTAASAKPVVKRHLKATQANSTPATDGKNVVVLFGSIGLLACYDFDGNLRWTAELPALDAGWFYDKSYQWGHASSPILNRDLVIVQADVAAGSFLGAWRLSDGKPAWKTAREDIPSWGTPTIYRGKEHDELIANGPTIRGYDPATGAELWRLAPNSEVTVATPIVAHDLVFVTAGYSPVQPIYAIRPGAKGDISLPESVESSEAIPWSKRRGGTYIPTPIVYGDYLYTCANDGRLTCYRANTGEEVFRARIGGGGGSFTASPVAADGRLYFTTETGEVHVVRAGPRYEELATNEMKDTCMSTPAISDGVMLVRTLKYLYGIGEPAPAEDP
jgi:outer membrane protein assembly factor BamB